MKKIYQTPWVLCLEFTNDVITTSVEGDDNVGGLPETGWTPGV